MKKILPAMTLVFFILSACSLAMSGSAMNTPTATTPHLDNPIPIPILTPVSADSNLLRDNVYLDSKELLKTEGSPLQFTLLLKGNLPTPCNQLRVSAEQPDADKQIFVDVYSVTKPGEACAQTLQPFEESFPLGSFPAGHYSIWINGQLLTEFDA
jgi:hypothetical protein